MLEKLRQGSRGGEHELCHKRSRCDCADDDRNALGIDVLFQANGNDEYDENRNSSQARKIETAILLR
jgi:hypothetical protein